MNSDMSFHMTTPTFFLYRNAGPNEVFDPTAEIQFYPPKDSDELFDALRSAYPTAKTHSERMRNAVIDFLVKERDLEQAKAQVASTPSTLSSWPSNSTSPTLSSPDLIDLATPASAASPMPAMSRQPSRSSTTGRSSMEQMTNVFSLSSNSQLKTRVRRKMTDSEKAEYRKRRIVKACDKCSKRKRKCHHNQEQMEVINPSGKVVKRKSPSNSASSFQIEQIAAPSSSIGDLDSLSFLTDDPLFSFQELAAPASSNIMDFDFSPQIAQAEAEAWPWSDTQDWTLMDTPSINDTVQSEPLFGDFIGYTNQDSMVPRAIKQQLSNHSWQAHSTHPAGTMESTVNPRLLQAQCTSTGSKISAINVGPMVNSDLVHTDEDPGNSGGSSPAGFELGVVPCQPTHTLRYYGESDRGALISTSESGLSGRMNGSLLPDAPSSDLPLLHGGPTTPSRSAHPGSVVNDKAVAFRNEEDQIATGHGLSSRQSLIKNKGPEHASRASAATAGLNDGNDGLLIEAHIVGGNGRKVPTSNVHRRQGENATKPSYDSSIDTATSLKGGAHVTWIAPFGPAFLRDIDFNLDFYIASTGASSSESGSSTTRSTVFLAPELIQSFSDHNSAPEACHKQRLASAGIASSPAPMVVAAGLDEGVSSRVKEPASLMPRQGSRSASGESLPTPSGNNASSVKIQFATSSTGHILKSSHVGSNAAAGSKQGRLGVNVTSAQSASLMQGSLTPRGSKGRTSSPLDGPSLAGPKTGSASHTPSSSASVVLKAAKNKRVPMYDTDDKSHAEQRPYRPLPSGVRASHGKESLVEDSAVPKVLSGVDNASLVMGEAYAGVDAAVATISLVSSGYLLGLASALTGELLKSMMYRGQKSGLGSRTTTIRGLWMGNIVACV